MEKSIKTRKNIDTIKETNKKLPRDHMAFLWRAGDFAQKRGASAIPSPDALAEREECAQRWREVFVLVTDDAERAVEAEAGDREALDMAFGECGRGDAFREGREAEVSRDGLEDRSGIVEDADGLVCPRPA